MKSIKIATFCSILFASITAQAMDDPEMDKIDMSPEARMEPRAGIDKSLMVDVTATVTAVDRENRMVVIQDSDGNSRTIYVTNQVKNLPQVQVGDKVDITYYRAAVVDLVKTKGDVELGTELTVAEISAPAGSSPARSLGTEVKRTVEIYFVDPYQKFIRVFAPDIGIRTVTLEHRPDLHHYLEELKKGDIVQVTYTEALAVSVKSAD